MLKLFQMTSARIEMKEQYITIEEGFFSDVRTINKPKI